MFIGVILDEFDGLMLHSCKAGGVVGLVSSQNIMRRGNYKCGELPFLKNTFDPTIYHAQLCRPFHSHTE